MKFLQKSSYEFDVRAFKPLTDGGIINVPVEHRKVDISTNQQLGNTELRTCNKTGEIRGTVCYVSKEASNKLHSLVPP